MGGPREEGYGWEPVWRNETPGETAPVCYDGELRPVKDKRQTSSIDMATDRNQWVSILEAAKDLIDGPY